MVGLEGVGAGGLILRDDFKDTYAGTSKERREHRFGFAFRTSGKRSIYLRYLCDFEFKIYRERKGAYPIPSKYIHINFFLIFRVYDRILYT